jgi:hypothetical protein
MIWSTILLISVIAPFAYKLVRHSNEEEKKKFSLAEEDVETEISEMDNQENSQSFELKENLIKSHP